MKIGKFEEDWEVDFPNSVIRLKPQTFIKRIRNWRKYYKLSDFHGFARAQEASEIGMPFPSIIDSDAMKPVKGVPKKLELINNWQIPENNLKKIIGDGYVLIGYGKLLVPEESSKILDAINIRPGLFGLSIDLKKLFGKRN